MNLRTIESKLFKQDHYVPSHDERERLLKQRKKEQYNAATSGKHFGRESGMNSGAQDYSRQGSQMSNVSELKDVSVLNVPGKNGKSTSQPPNSQSKKLVGKTLIHPDMNAALKPGQKPQSLFPGQTTNTSQMSSRDSRMQ